MQCGEFTLWGDFEDRAIEISPAIGGCPVEVAVGGLD